MGSEINNNTDRLWYFDVMIKCGDIINVILVDFKKTPW
jgi:hypothetical protein